MDGMNPIDGDYVSAREAADLLGVKANTLYTYVSRGFIRSVAQPGRKARLYYREDVAKAQARSEARQGQGPAAESAMRWGQPVINTTITEITPAGPRYRGHSAIDLVRSGGAFEAVADLLWTGVWHESTRAWPVTPRPEEFQRLVRAVSALRPERQIRRALAAVAEMLALTLASGAEARLATAPARQLIHALAGTFALLRPGAAYANIRDGESVAAFLARAAKLKVTAAHVAALDAALIVSADHELAPSTFAARIAASTGGDVQACVVSALCAFEGSLTGLGCDKAEDLLAGARNPKALAKRFAGVQQQGQKFPGFNHPFYARGDPRALLLIELAKSLPSQSALSETVYTFLDYAAKEFQAYPSLPIGLVTLSSALGLPQRAAGALMAIGRSAGWIAHVQEQRTAGFLLRPRARYVGVAA